MKKLFRTTKAFVAMCSILAISYSCSEDAEKLLDDQGLTKTDVSSVLKADDISGLTDSMLTDIFAANTQSGKFGNTNKTDNCFETTFTNTGYSATFVNCAVDGAENVNGTINVTFALENGTLEYTATYADFTIGDISIEGTKGIVLNSSANDTEMSLSVTSNITIVLEDDSVVKETGTKTLVVTQGVSDTTSTVTVEGEWALQVDNDIYAISVIDTLEGNLACDYITAGVMGITKNGLSVKVNFGEGTCDDSAILIYPNGVEEEFTLED
ncbi:hypothetical protein [uncultured Maribacter sp.]|uniref:hypothetical protein n=1 Tax=uncultured Maribacter sp. TaxID=431308 RepID=UPI00262BC62A|nr:hypothetical protein [uncultured Maribacter sp.]